jgi:hypothetical protein
MVHPNDQSMVNFRTKSAVGEKINFCGNPPATSFEARDPKQHQIAFLQCIIKLLFLTMIRRLGLIKNGIPSSLIKSYRGGKIKFIVRRNK